MERLFVSVTNKKIRKNSLLVIKLMKPEEKVFCLGCKIRIETKKSMPAIFGGDNTKRPAVEYEDGWRCASCADKYQKIAGGK